MAHSRLASPLALALLGLLAAGIARADVVPDQSQIGWQGSTPPLDIGGHLRQQAAQTYRAGVSGTLDHVRLLIGCDDSTLGAVHVDIQAADSTGAPGGPLLGSASIDSLELVPSDAGDYLFRDFFPAGVQQEAGTDYVIVMRGDEGTICYTPRGPVAGSMFAYPRGDAWLGQPAGASLAWTKIEDPVIDLVFYTFVDRGGPDFCEVDDVSGAPNQWLPADVPACACLEDPVLKAHRCWFGLPDFVLWREIVPFEAVDAVVEWHLLPLASGLEEVVVQESAGGASGPELVFAKSLKPGKTQSLKASTVPAGSFSEVSVLFIGPRGDAEVKYRVQLDIPGSQ